MWEELLIEEAEKRRSIFENINGILRENCQGY